MKSKKIQVGMIRCDLHGYYYAIPMFKHDPIALRDDQVGRGQGAHFYFYTSYDDPRMMTRPSVRGFQLARVWDENREVAEAFAGIFGHNAKVCKTFREVSDDVDLVFIADCSGDGSDHLKLAAPGLKKGVPTFVDKPFAYEVKDARKMVSLAKRHQTPTLSMSMLRALPHAARFRNRFRETKPSIYTVTETKHPIQLGIVRGYMPAMPGHIHGISLAQHLFGAGVEWVEALGKEENPLEYLRLCYPDRGLEVLIINTMGGPYDAAYASVYSWRGWHGAIHSPPFDDWSFPYGAVEILKKIKKMVLTRNHQAPYEEMLECIAIATAGRLAQKERRRVYLKEV